MNLFSRKAITIIFICSLFFNLNNSFAKKTKDDFLKLGDNKKIGQAIAEEYDDRDLGFNDQISKMKMILINAYGDKNTRLMEARIFERQDRDIGDKSLLLFFNPKDLNGTAMLSFANILKSDEQWLYLPSLKRVKRISSKNKSGPFVGSEFAYEDITGNEINKYEWTFIATEKCPILDNECFKLETIPKYEFSGYTKRILWIDVEEFRLDKIDFFDRKNALLKTQAFYDYKKYLNKFWRADKWIMKNHQTEKSTELLFEKYYFQVGLDDNDFHEKALRRIREWK
mgnify:FL=1